MQAIFFYWYKVLQTKVLNAFKMFQYPSPFFSFGYTANEFQALYHLLWILIKPHRSHALESMSQMDNKIIVLLREET